MLGDQCRTVTQGRIAVILSLSAEGAHIHSLAYPSHRTIAMHPPLVVTFHVYQNPKTEDFRGKDEKGLTLLALVVYCVILYTILLRLEGHEDLTIVMIWLIHSILKK